jgi:hypothetical protein
MSDSLANKQLRHSANHINEMAKKREQVTQHNNTFGALLVKRLLAGPDYNERIAASIPAQDSLGKATRERLEAGLLPQENIRRIDYYSSDPVQPSWGSRQQSEWQSSGRHSATSFEGADRWGDIEASSPHGSVGRRVVDDDSENRRTPALPVSATDMRQLALAERPTYVKNQPLNILTRPNAIPKCAEL